MSDGDANPIPEKSSVEEQTNMETECVTDNNDKKLSLNESPKENKNSSGETAKDSERDITNILNLGHAENREDSCSAEIIQTQYDSHASEASSSSKNKQRSKNRKRSGHVRKRKWRPLWKLTGKERDKLYEREMKRIQREKEELRAAGVALAPHNTSEFLIEDRGLSSLDDEDLSRSEPYERQPFEKEFDEIYESVSYNIYDKLTKFELVERWIEAEDRNEALEKQLKAVREKKRLLGLSGNDVDSQMTKIEVFKEEIKKLVKENDELQKKNERLKKYLIKSE